MVIRPTGAGDAAQLADVHIAASEEAYADLLPAEFFASRWRNRDDRVEQWAQILRDPGHTVLVAEEDAGRLVGFVCLGPGRDEPQLGLPTAEVWSLYVMASAHGAGIGYTLLTEALGPNDAYLWVLDGNQRAVRFYKRQGFEFDGTTRTGVIGLERRMVRI